MLAKAAKDPAANSGKMQSRSESQQEGEKSERASRQLLQSRNDSDVLSEAAAAGTRPQVRGGNDGSGEQFILARALSESVLSGKHQSFIQCAC
jgi:hypothetical protein